MRINKYLAACGLGSRRKCEQLVTDGLVTVNDVLAEQLGLQVNPGDSVKVSGLLVEAIDEIKYLLLNKPAGFLTSVSDDRGRNTVMDLVTAVINVKPVGRLDLDTTGALLMTNDGELAFRLTHPRFKISKVYQALLWKPMEQEDVSRLEAGVHLEDGLTAPCSARMWGDGRRIQVILREGRKRQVKRMFDVIGYRVRQLHRSEFAGISVKGLDEGKWRELTVDEVFQLKQKTGLLK